MHIPYDRNHYDVQLMDLSVAPSCSSTGSGRRSGPCSQGEGGMGSESGRIGAVGVPHRAPQRDPTAPVPRGPAQCAEGGWIKSAPVVVSAVGTFANYLLCLFRHSVQKEAGSNVSGSLASGGTSGETSDP